MKKKIKFSFASYKSLATPAHIQIATLFIVFILSSKVFFLSAHKAVNGFTVEKYFGGLNFGKYSLVHCILSARLFYGVVVVKRKSNIDFWVPEHHKFCYVTYIQKVQESFSLVSQEMWKKSVWERNVGYFHLLST